MISNKNKFLEYWLGFNIFWTFISLRFFDARIYYSFNLWMKISKKDHWNPKDLQYMEKFLNLFDKSKWHWLRKQEYEKYVQCTGVKLIAILWSSKVLFSLKCCILIFYLSFVYNVSIYLFLGKIELTLVYFELYCTNLFAFFNSFYTIQTSFSNTQKVCFLLYFKST